MRKTFTAAPGEPVARFGRALPLLIRLGLVVHGCVTQSGGDRIDDRFEQPDQGRDLGLRQSVDQVVGLLAGVGHRLPPESALREARF